MSEQKEILVLRDEAGAPFLLPLKVVEQEELVAFRVGTDEYLLPRKKLLDAKVPEATAHGAEALSVRAPDGTYFLIPAETLEQAHVGSDEERAVAEEVLDADVVAHSQLEFEISPLGVQELGVSGRGFGASFVS